MKTGSFGDSLFLRDCCQETGIHHVTRLALCCAAHTDYVILRVEGSLIGTNPDFYSVQYAV